MDINKILQRFKSKKAFLAVVSLIIIIFNSFGLYEKTGIDETVIQNLSDGILAVLVGIGIYSNFDE